VSAEPLVSVVIPTLDEEGELPGVLDHLASLSGRWEPIVADGGSRDRTLQIARERGAGVVARGATRAAQLNAAARATGGEVLLFLHADSRLPAGAHASIAAAVREPGVAGGNFALRFEGDDRFARVLTAAYSLQRRRGFYYGDSSIWVRREVFSQLGGYRELPIMDDYDFVRRLERDHETRCLPGPARTSARRWRALGVPRTLASWWVIRLLFIAGVPPARLAGLYRRIR
jgi:rSAM/selenodomain-associated transferase 2